MTERMKCEVRSKKEEGGRGTLDRRDRAEGEEALAEPVAPREVNSYCASQGRD